MHTLDRVFVGHAGEKSVEFLMFLMPPEKVAVPTF